MSPTSPCSTVPCEIEGGRSWLGWSQWNSKLPCALSQTLSFHVVSRWPALCEANITSNADHESCQSCSQAGCCFIALSHTTHVGSCCLMIWSCEFMWIHVTLSQALDLQQWQSGIMTAPPLRQGCHIIHIIWMQLTRLSSKVTAPNDAEPASASLLDGVYLARNLATLATHNLQWYH